MNIEDFYNYCQSKKGVTQDFPFDNDTIVFKIGGKMFALASLKKWEEGNPSVNLKCNPEYALELRAEYQAIEAGYHMNKKHWNTVYLNQDVPPKLFMELLDHSYELVLESLPKKVANTLK